MPYCVWVKMTMHIDDALLARVMSAFGCNSKTEAVEMALREMDRKHRFREFVKTPCKFTPEELKSSVDVSYDPLSLRVAEPAVPYDGATKTKSDGRKRSGR